MSDEMANETFLGATIEGLPEVVGNLDELTVKADRAARALILDTVLFAEVTVVNKIDEYHAVATGRLRGSVVGVGPRPPMKAKGLQSASDTATEIHAPTADDYRATIGTNLEYALPVHEGYTKKLKAKAVRPVYGALRGKLTARRVAGAERSSGRQSGLLVSTASYSRSAQGDITIHVAPRPFMADGIPEIADHFKSEAVAIFGQYGIGLTVTAAT